MAGFSCFGGPCVLLPAVAVCHRGRGLNLVSLQGLRGGGLSYVSGPSCVFTVLLPSTLVPPLRRDVWVWSWCTALVPHFILSVLTFKVPWPHNIRVWYLCGEDPRFFLQETCYLLGESYTNSTKELILADCAGSTFAPASGSLHESV